MSRASAQAARPRTVAGTGTTQIADLEAQALAAEADTTDADTVAPEASADAGLPATYQQAATPHMELPQTPRPAAPSAPTPAPVSQDDEDDEATAPESSQPGRDAAPDAQSDEAERFSLEEVRRLRREAAKYRTELRAAQQRLAEVAQIQEKLQQLEEQSLSEQERRERQLEREQQRAAEAQARLDQLNARERERTLEVEVIRQSRALNIVDEDAAYRLLDREAIEYDDTGSPTNVKDVLKSLVKQRSYLVAPATESRPSPANPPRRQPEAEEPRQLSVQERRARIYGRGGSLWEDPRRQGGGVFMPNLNG